MKGREMQDENYMYVQEKLGKDELLVNISRVCSLVSLKGIFLHMILFKDVPATIPRQADGKTGKYPTDLKGSPQRGFTFLWTQPTMASSELPGGNTSLTPMAFSFSTSLSGIIPPPITNISSAPSALSRPMIF